jgi:preprotein translocase subunit YajC
VWFKGRYYEVSEVSEGGVMILLGDGCAVRLGQSFVAVIRFQDGETNSIVGVVLRIDEKKMVVKLSKGVSLKRMMAEQIRIRKKYPMFFESNVGESETESG